MNSWLTCMTAASRTNEIDLCINNCTMLAAATAICIHTYTRTHRHAKPSPHSRTRLWPCIWYAVWHRASARPTYNTHIIHMTHGTATPVHHFEYDWVRFANRSIELGNAERTHFRTTKISAFSQCKAATAKRPRSQQCIVLRRVCAASHLVEMLYVQT